MNVVFANIDYEKHTTDEGNQFQLGLHADGWTLVGRGYRDEEVDTIRLLEKYEPEMVVVHDKRDWDPANGGCFRKDVGFTRIEALADYPGFVTCVLKDAGSMKDYHRRFVEEINADAVICYYHPDVVRSLNGWLKAPIIRTYHSIDASLCRRLVRRTLRNKAVVTGATSAAYPLRTRFMKFALRYPHLGISVVGHPGYHNRGTDTPSYLNMLASYRVHVATASVYGFALRKIIESVALGCTPVTNLPAFDKLPGIDDALFRVQPNASVTDVMRAVERANAEWDYDERLSYAQKAWTYYDWPVIGRRLSGLLHEAAR